MDPERWRRMEELFEAAVNLSAAERVNYVRAASSGDTALEGEVLDMLAADGGQRMEWILSAEAGSLLANEAESVPGRIGAYEVLRLLGSGGMGAVYLARRADEQYDQQVAIKLIRHADPALVRRFLAERSILARLNHPNIARLLDGGLTTEGAPYLVMEYVDGPRIDHYCRDKALSVRERIELFLQVCAGVQCAHRNLIVHRDLKPGNVLVAPDGAVKLLDFGIAKILEPGGAPTGEATRMTQRLMTPEYASPEQVMGKPVTTAADVYALGLLLYELLTGERAISLAGTDESWVRMVLEGSIPRPSEAAAEARQLAGDLDNIVMKAVSKEPERRYGSAAEFAEDLRRFLDSRPVSARPDTLRYRAGKFVQRNRLTVAVAGVALLAILGFSAGMAGLARRAAVERDTARQERDRATHVTSFLTSLFENINPDRSRTESTRDLMERGLSGVERLNNDPDAQWQLYASFSQIQDSLGDYPRALELNGKAEAIVRGRMGPRSLELSDVLKTRTDLLRRLRRLDEGEAAAREAIGIRRQKLPANDVRQAEILNSLALIVQEKGSLREAERLFLEVLRFGDALRQVDNLQSAVLSNLGGLYTSLGDSVQAERFLAECVAIRRKELKPPHPRLALAISKLANVLSEQPERLEEAEKLHREALEIRRRLSPRGSPDVASSLVLLAKLRNLKRDGKEAGVLLEEASELLARLPAPEVRRGYLIERTYWWELAGNYAEARKTAEECWREDQKAGPGRSLFAAESRWDMVRLSLAWGKPEPWSGELCDALALVRARRSPNHKGRIRVEATAAKMPGGCDTK
ncbi:MAG: serine/threonine protein kinase [Acidobacteria bacterium]|nr:serine/threonine protein kinase [Acidobacteriota bacterium]